MKTIGRRVLNRLVGQPVQTTFDGESERVFLGGGGGKHRERERGGSFRL